jgi:hypothetical protein
MKKYSWMVALFAIMAIAFGGFVSCGGGGGGGGKVTIEFDANEGLFSDGEETREIEIDEGGTVTAPTDVTLAGHILTGWNTSHTGIGGTILTSDTGHPADTKYFAMWTLAPVLNVTVSIKAGDETIPDVVINGRGGNNGVVTALDGKNGYVHTAGTAGHRGKYAWFEIDFGDKRLSDFKEITFTYDVIEAGFTNSTDNVPQDGRRIALIASASPLGSANLSAHANAAGSTAGYLALGQVTKAMTEDLLNSEANRTVTLEIVPASSYLGPTCTVTDNALNASKVWLSIYEHTGPSAVVNIYDIEFIPWPEGTCNYCYPNPCDGTCDAAISAAKVEVEGATYEKTIATTSGTIAQARAAVEEIISKLSLNDVAATVIDGTFTAAGVGVPGSYNFTVELRRGIGTMQVTTSLTLTITYEVPPSFNIVRSGFADGEPFVITEAVLASMSHVTEFTSASAPISRWGGSNEPFSLDSNGLLMGPRSGNGGIVLNLAALGLSVTENKYTFVITGTTTNGALRINADSSMLTGGLTFAEVNGTNLSYSATFTLGAAADPVRNPLAIRLTGNANAVAAVTTITSITITKVD